MMSSKKLIAFDIFSLDCHVRALEINTRFMLGFFSIYQSGYDDIIMATFPHSFRGGGNGL